MGIISAISIRNFKCFRERVEIDLRQGSYIIGPNNSGKTAVLNAINCFFDSDSFQSWMLNKSEFSRRQAAFNRSDISITFDLSFITARARRDRMKEEHGDYLEITKSFTWREASSTVSIQYKVKGKAREYEKLDPDVKYLVESIHVSYIHPQEGDELLAKAQQKFKARLFHNWGRHVSVSEKLAAVEAGWTDLRKTANAYLSKALTEKIRAMWPHSEVKIELPEKLEQIVAISEITFRSAQNLPEVTLTSHGTGAQSTILYQTHFLLDSDRSLHRGMYFPVWLLEEPESFLHADLAFQLARLLASSDWQTSIQMFISTHSPIILAASHQNPASANWILVDKHSIQEPIRVEDVTSLQIASIGKLMGDPNFEAYFYGASSKRLIFLEDTRSETKAAFEDVGVQVEKCLNGITEVKAFLSVYMTVPDSIQTPIYFVVDSDDGIKEISAILKGALETVQESGWTRYKIAEQLYVVALPDGLASEDLFAEWPTVVDDVIDEVLNRTTLKLRKTTPTRLSRVVDAFRKRPALDIDDARKRVRNIGDVKDRFWELVGSENCHIKTFHADAIKKLC